MEQIKGLLTNSIGQIFKEEGIDRPNSLEIFLERPKDKKFGDFSTNIAMLIASSLKKSPRDIAGRIIKGIKSADIAKVDIAGPGFINFYMHSLFWHNGLKETLKKREKYGRLDKGKGKRVMVEFVSANPTGPLHVGHGRGAVVGDVLSNILKAYGYDVHKEYYINDRGNQMNNLGLSVLARYKQLFGIDSPLPENGYKGDYISDVAKKIISKDGDIFLKKTIEETLPYFTKYAIADLTQWIRDDLSGFGIEFDQWFSEATLFADNKVATAINRLKEKGYTYEKDGALWLKSSSLGDDKDRVIIRGNGEHTYLAADIAYHTDKLERGFDKLINIWGADHHGYIPRLKGVIEALGYDKNRLAVILVQMVNLKKGDQYISMSTREDKFVPLSDVINEVGKDVSRFFFMMRSSDSHLDFDMDLALKESKDNPVYYVQYAHARISSIEKMANEAGIKIPHYEDADMSLLILPEEIELIKYALTFPDMISKGAENLEPHIVTYYLQEIASLFHAYYYRYKIISDDKSLTNARLVFIDAIRTVLRNALSILGITPMEKM